MGLVLHTVMLAVDLAAVVSPIICTSRLRSDSLPVRRLLEEGAPVAGRLQGSDCRSHRRRAARACSWMAAAAQGARAGAALQMNKQHLFRSDRHFGHHVCCPCIWQCKTTVCPLRCHRLSGGIPTCTFVSPLPWTLFVALRHLQRRDAREMLSTCALSRHITEARCKSAAAAPLSVRRRQRAGMVHLVNGRPGNMQ